MPQAAIEHRCVPPLDLPEEARRPRAFRVVRAAGPATAATGTSVSARTSDAATAAITAAASGWYMRPFDARHAEERQEHDDDDERRERDRAARPRSPPRAPAPAFLRAAVAPTSRCRMFSTMMIDGVDQQPDGDRQAAERHGVEPDAERPQEKARQRDRERDGERDDQRGPDVAEQHEEHQRRRRRRPASPRGRRRRALSVTSCDWS